MNTAGSICADFAGTLDEARTFAKENGLKAPQNGLYRKVNRINGCSVVTAPYKTKAERVVAKTKMEKLGWGEGSWYDRPQPTHS